MSEDSLDCLPVRLGRPGAGKTAILEALHARLSGALLTSREFIEASAARHPLALDETAYAVLATALSTHDVVLVDMMTAMDVGNLPPALVRSGRIELCLETRLPTAAARADILGERCAELPATIGPVEIDALVAETEGLTGADLKRVVEDGKLLFAFERSRGVRMQPATTYFLQAIKTVRRNKEQYAAAEARARARHPVRPPYFDAFTAIDAMEMGRTTRMPPSFAMMMVEGDS